MSYSGVSFFSIVYIFDILSILTKFIRYTTGLDLTYFYLIYCPVRHIFINKTTRLDRLLISIYWPTLLTHKTARFGTPLATIMDIYKTLKINPFYTK